MTNVHSERRVAASLSVAVALIAVGCKEPTPCTKHGAKITIIGNHGHEAKIPKDAFESQRGNIFPVTGGSHKHALPAKTEHLVKLNEGGSISLRTTSVNAHLHEVDVVCAP